MYNNENLDVISDGHYDIHSTYKKDPIPNKHVSGKTNDEYSRPDEEQRYLTDFTFRHEHTLHLLNRKTAIRPHDTLLNKVSIIETGINANHTVSNKIYNY